jgi:hypothetical protein
MPTSWSAQPPQRRARIARAHSRGRKDPTSVRPCPTARVGRCDTERSNADGASPWLQRINGVGGDERGARVCNRTFVAFPKIADDGSRNGQHFVGRAILFTGFAPHNGGTTTCIVPVIGKREVADGRADAVLALAPALRPSSGRRTTQARGLPRSSGRRCGPVTERDRARERARLFLHAETDLADVVVEEARAVRVGVRAGATSDGEG